MNILDIVRISYEEEYPEWAMLRARIIGFNNVSDEVLLEPLSDRPDGQGRKSFYWDASNIKIEE